MIEKKGKDRFGISLNILGNRADVCGDARLLAREFGTKVLEVELEKSARETLLGPNAAEEQRKMRELRDEEGLVLQLHAPYRPREDSDIAAADPVLRKRALDIQLASLEVTGAIGAVRMTLHPGCKTTIETPQEPHVLILCESLAILQERAVALGVQLCLENMAANKRVMVHLSPEEVREVCRKTGVRYTLDMPHWATWYGHVTGLMVTETAKICPYVANVHLADTVPPDHKHLPIGEGTSPLHDVVALLLQRGYQGNFIVEEPWPGYIAERYIEAGKNFRDEVFPA